MANVDNYYKPPVLPSARPLGIDLVSVSPSDNPITYLLRTLVIGATDGYARALILVTGAGTTVGDKITLNGIEFEATADPNLGEWLPSGSALASAEAIKQMLEDDPNFNRDYKIEQISTAVYVTAKKPGSRWDLSATTVSAGLFVPAPNAGIDRFRSQTFEDYSVYVEVWAGLAGTPFGYQSTSGSEYVSRLFQPANLENIYPFDVAPIVANLVEADIPKIPVATFSRQSSAIAAYYLKFGEMYKTPGGTGLIRREIGQTDPAFVVNCGLPLLDQPKLNEYADYSGTPNASFLTVKPDRKLSRKDSFEWLYLIYIPQTTDLRFLSIAFNVTFVDGTNSGWKFAKTATAKPGVLYWRVDYASLGIGTITAGAGKEALRWTVAVLEHTSPTPSYNPDPQFKTGVLISKETSYILSESCRPEPLLLVWLNSLGGWESFSFDGTKDRSAAIKKSTYERSAPIDFSGGHRREEKVRAVTTSESFILQTFRSELVNADHHEFLRSLFESPTVYLVENYSFRYVSEITTKWERKGEDQAFIVEGVFRLTVPENVLKE